MALPTPPTWARIRAVALDLFTSQGYDATSMRALADGVGLTTAALYYHFDGKEALLVSLVEPYVEALDRLLGDASPGSDGGRRELLAGYLDLLIREADVVRLLERDPAVRSHPDLGPRLQRQTRRLQELLAAGGDDDATRVRVTACLGALRAPVTATSVDLEPLRPLLLDATLHVLDAGSVRTERA